MELVKVRKTWQICAAILFSLAAAFGALSKQRRSTPALELLNAARLADARASQQGFEIHANIRLEQENAKGSDGTYHLVWASPTQWREEFSFSDFHQVRVSAPGGVWEEREPHFLSLRMWQVMQALGFYGRFVLPKEESAGRIKLNKKAPDLRCVEIARNAYPLDELCFHGDVAQLVSEHYLPSDRLYEFADYRTVRTKFFPGHISVSEGGVHAADFSVSDVKEIEDIPTTSLEPPAQAKWRSWCPSPEAGGDELTPIYSRLVQHDGASILYGSLGTNGKWQDIRVLESGGSAHDVEVLKALGKERWKPPSCNAVPIVVETVFRR
jgi:hypothetical protein